MNEPLLKKKHRSYIHNEGGISLLTNFIIPAPSPNKILFSSILSFVIIATTLSAVLVLVFARHTTFGGMKLSKYLFTIDGVVGGYVCSMLLVTAAMRLGAKFSKRFRYFTAPFVYPIYTSLWAVLCLELVPILVPEINDMSNPTKLLKNAIGIITGCSIASVVGSILLIAMERVVYGDLQEQLWNALWSERCVTVVALPNRDPCLRAMTEKSQPKNILSLAHMIQRGNHGLTVWLGLAEVDLKDNHSPSRCAANVTNMIMRRDFTNKGYLSVSDLTSIPDLSTKDARRLFQVFDLNSQGHATPEDIKGAITNILIEKKSIVDMCIARSLIVDIVKQIVHAIVAMICVIITLVILLRVNLYTLLVGLGTTLIGLGFALSSTLQGILESLQMIFFVRPFEIGDIVQIDDGPPMQVERVTIVATFLYAMDGYGVYYPNAELARSRIANWRRSKDVAFDIPLYLSMETQAEHIAALKHEIQHYMETNTQFNPKFLLVVSDTQETYVIVILRVSLKSIWQECAGWQRYASDLRVFATEKIVKMRIQYQEIEICKSENVPNGVS